MLIHYYTALHFGWIHRYTGVKYIFCHSLNMPKVVPPECEVLIKSLYNDNMGQRGGEKVENSWFWRKHKVC